MADDQGQRRLARQRKATETQTALFVANVDRFLNKNLRQILKNILDGKTSGVESAQVLGSLIGELEKRGLAKELAKLRDAYGDELRFVIDEFGEQKLKVAFADTDADIVYTLIDNGVRQVANEIERYGLDVQSKVMQAVLTSKRPTFDELEGQITPKLRANLETELNTALMTFSQTVTSKKALDLGFDLFLYEGPDDEITRPFCRDLLRQSPAIYSLDEIYSMDNGQGLPVFTARGGYNCRHHWRPVSEERARELGYRG